MLILRRLSLLFLSSIVLYFAWPPSNFGPLMFVGFIPIFFYIDTFREKSKFGKYIWTFLGLYATMSLFSSMASFNAWGDYNPSVILGLVLNFLPVTAVVSFFVLFRNKKVGLLFLVFAWASMELFNLKWELSAPFFLLSNGLSTYPSIIQHYAVWGGIGGTIYILSMNIAGYLLINKLILKQAKKKELILFAALLLPTLFSLISYSIPEKYDRKVTFGLVLPNFDQYKEKYSLDPSLLIHHYNELFESHKSQKYDVLLLPETAVLNSGWIENLNRIEIDNPLDSLLPNQELLLGSYFFSIYQPQTEAEPYNVLFDTNSNLKYQTHNCVIHRSSDNYYKIRSKKKFVPFHEVMPYPSILMFTEDWVNYVGQKTYVAEYTKKPNTVMTSSEKVKMYPLLCYESLFSDVFLELDDYQLVCVLTNEYWNDKDLGKRQYVHHLTPKAIETGRPILKASNGGHSAYVNAKGQIVEFIDYKKSQIKSVTVGLNDSKSIYSSIYAGWHGLIVFLTLVLIIVNFFKKK